MIKIIIIREVNQNNNKSELSIVQSQQIEFIVFTFSLRTKGKENKEKKTLNARRIRYSQKI